PLHDALPIFELGSNPFSANLEPIKALRSASAFSCLSFSFSAFTCSSNSLYSPCSSNRLCSNSDSRSSSRRLCLSFSLCNLSLIISSSSVCVNLFFSCCVFLFLFFIFFLVSFFFVFYSSLFLFCFTLFFKTSLLFFFSL